MTIKVMRFYDLSIAILPQMTKHVCVYMKTMKTLNLVCN